MICRGHPTGLPSASLVPGHMALCLLQTPRAPEPVLRHTLKPVLLGGWQERSVEDGQGAGSTAQGMRIQGVAETHVGDTSGRREVVQAAVAGGRSPCPLELAGHA